jgi:hypothetical protein
MTWRKGGAKVPQQPDAELEGVTPLRNHPTRHLTPPPFRGGCNRGGASVWSGRAGGHRQALFAGAASGATRGANEALKSGSKN